MNRRFKFFLFSFCVVFSLVFQISYLKLKDEKVQEKLIITKLTSLNSFAFYTQIPYLRHNLGHGINETFKYHPAFRESETGSFVNSGYAKRFIQK